MAKLSLDKLKLLRDFLSPNFSPREVNYFLSKNNQYKVYSAYKNRASVKISFNGEVFIIDFSSLSYDILPETKNISENVTKSKPVHNARGKGKRPVKKVTSVALDPEMFERLKLMADERGTSTGYLIRLSLKGFLENNN